MTAQPLTERRGPGRPPAGADDPIERLLALVDPSDEFPHLSELRHPILTPAAEAEAGRRIRQAARRAAEASGARRAAALLVFRQEVADSPLLSHNLRLVFSIAIPYRGRGVPLMDLYQEGKLGLWRAAEKYNPDLINPKTGRPNRFTTYATWWIRQHVTRYIIDTNNLIRLPVHVAEKLSAHTRGRETAYSPEAIRRLYQIQEIGSLDQPITLDGSDDPVDMHGVIPSSAPGPEELTELAELGRSLRRILREATEDGDIDSRAATIILKLHELDPAPPGKNGAKPTLESLGEEHGITRERTRQIVKAAYKELARRCVREGLHVYL